ncbi:MAG TPA: Gfo/Idh/MocA family oxidoreductase [Ruminiclostridium sp.]
MDSKKLKYGIIGCGGIASLKHLAGYAKMGDVEIVAVCDSNYERALEAAKTYNVPNCFKDTNEMLKMKNLDIVSICVPNFLHAPMTIAALEAGKHVHCEKPPALSAVEVQKMIDARDKSGKKLMVGLNYLFYPSTDFVKKFIDGGGMGDIYYAKCGWLRRRGIPGKGGWFTSKEKSGGGPLIDLGVHFIELAMYLMGSPKPVTVSGSTYCKFANSTNESSFSGNTTFQTITQNAVFDVEDTAMGFIRMDNGATMITECTWASNIEEEYNYYELFGTKAGIRFRNGKLQIFSEINGTLVDIAPKITDIPFSEDEIRHFVDCVKEDKEPIARAEDSMEVMRIIESIYASAEKKCEIKF